jgi:hypothetical protein
MKGLILALMMSGAASAETITLGTDECGIIKQCVNIPNDAAIQFLSTEHRDIRTFTSTSIMWTTYRRWRVAHRW